VSPLTLGILVIVVALILLFFRCPVFVSLGIAAMVGILLLQGIPGLIALPMQFYYSLHNFVLLAAPLFLIMGSVLAETDMGSDLYTACARWFNHLPGGLAIASIFACAIFGAMSGISIAGVAAIGVMAVPEMTKRGYDTRLATGSVTAAGALAMLIPPSLMFIVYGALADVSVGELFVGGIFPGILMALLMSVYVIFMVERRPQMAPSIKGITWAERLSSLARLWPVLLVIAAALVTIYTGICTPTEAGAAGAAVALLLALFYYRQLSRERFKAIMGGATRTVSAICIIYACAWMFGVFLTRIGLPDMLAQWVATSGFSPWMVIILVNLIIFAGGMFVDGLSLILITTPILLPLIITIGYPTPELATLWYGIMVVINENAAVITPPLGLNLYTMKSVVPDVELSDIMRGTLPFLGAEIACLALFIIFPQIGLWLPTTMRG
jgi:TRAP transporter, DctM subunit